MSSSQQADDPNRAEAAHYVVTAHRPGAVLLTAKCSFLGSDTTDLVIAKSRRLEVHQLTSPTNDAAAAATTSSSGGGDGAGIGADAADSNVEAFPLILSVPINGRITTLLPFRHPNATTDYLFLTTERKRYAIISYEPSNNLNSGNSSGGGGGGGGGDGSDNPYQIRTHAAGTLADYGCGVMGRESETGPLACIDPSGSCVAVHLYDGFVTVLPINSGYVDPGRRSSAGSSAVAAGGSSSSLLASPGGGGRKGHHHHGRSSSSSSSRTSSVLLHPFNVRIEERTILSMSFLYTNPLPTSPNTAVIMPQLCLLHQDSRSNQHVVAHSIDLGRRHLISQSDLASSTAAGGGPGHAGGSKSPVPPPQAERLRKSRIDGGSGLIVAVPPSCSGGGGSAVVPRVPGAAAGVATAKASASASSAHRSAAMEEDEDDDDDDDDDDLNRKPAAASSTSTSTPRAPRSGGKSGMGGVLIFGQRQITYHCTADSITKVLPLGGGGGMQNAFVLAVDPILAAASASASGSRSASGVDGDEGDADNSSRYLLATESGHLHLLTLLRGNSTGGGKVTGLHLDTLGSLPSLPSTLTYLEGGLVFAGSQMGDSVLTRIGDDPTTTTTTPAQTTYLTVLEEYPNLGPIVDFDLIPTTHGGSASHKAGAAMSSAGGNADQPPLSSLAPTSSSKRHRQQQSMVVTASGTAASGTIRLIRNGIGLDQIASIDIGGIKGMWNLRCRWDDADDLFLVQSYVGESRVLGVVEDGDEEDLEEDAGEEVSMEEEDGSQMSQSTNGGNGNGEGGGGGGGTLAEVELSGFDSHRSTLFASNISVGNGTLAVQATESEVRVIDLMAHDGEGCICTYRPDAGDDDEDDDDPYGDRRGGGGDGMITVASGNESGQIVLALRGGVLLYLNVVETTTDGDGDGDGDVGANIGGVRVVTVGRTVLEREISCIDLHPFDAACADAADRDADDSMDVDDRQTSAARGAGKSALVAVGLWDDFTVRLLSLTPQLNEALRINLSSLSSSSDDGDAEMGGMDPTNGDGESGDEGRGGRSQHMMARSLCMVTLDSSSSTSSAAGASSSSTPGSPGSSSMQQQRGGTSSSSSSSVANKADMLLVGLGDGGLISFAVTSSPSTSTSTSGGKRRYAVHSRKEVSLGTRTIGLVPFRSAADCCSSSGATSAVDSAGRGGGVRAAAGGGGGGGTCVLATGDRPTVVYLTGGGGGGGAMVNPKLCYSNVNLSTDPTSANQGDDAAADGRDASGGGGGGGARESLTVNVATPFHSRSLFSSSTSAAATSSSSLTEAKPTTATTATNKNYSLVVSDESTLRLGMIDDIQKLHVTTHRLGMSPRRVVHHEAGRVVAVGCIDAGRPSSSSGGDGQAGAATAAGGGQQMEGQSNMGNCIRFFDDTTFEEIDRLDLDPFEMILSMVSTSLKLTDPALEPSSTSSGGSKTTGEAMTTTGDNGNPYRPYILIGTAYAYPDEDEPTRGRVLVVRCSYGQGMDGAATSATGRGDESPTSPGAGHSSHLSRAARVVTEMSTKGGVYSICPFYAGSVLLSVNTKTHVCRLTTATGGGPGDVPELRRVGAGHHGHVLSLCIKSLVQPHGYGGEVQVGPARGGGDGMDPSASSGGGAGAKRKDKRQQQQQIAIVGDLMRSISVVQYYPDYQTLEEVARDYNANWTTAVEMLTEDVYLGGENWNNFFVLRRNPNAPSEEVRCRLDTIGEFNFGEMPNKFMAGSLVMPTTGSSGGFDGMEASDRPSSSSSSSTPVVGRSPKKAKRASGNRGPMKASVTIGSQTLFATVDGTIGSVIGIDVPTAAFFASLERCMARTIRPVADLSHSEFRAFVAEQRHHPSRGFVDGDFVESFLDLDRGTMERIVGEMNVDGKWEVEDLGGVAGGGGGGGPDGANINAAGDIEDGLDAGGGGTGSVLTVEDVLAMVEEISMIH